MEAIISAVLADLVGRAICLLVEKCLEQATPQEDLQRLQQLVLRIHVVVEEAEGRSITNEGMIRQVSMMREQMFRGYYFLDAFKSREKKTEEDEEVNLYLFARSEFNPAKRLRRLSSHTQIESMVICEESRKELKIVILGLENMFADMKEFAVFLMSYPRMYRQPYNAYLFLNKCMFGRQMEREQIISFLLQAEPQGSANLGVLPILGPALIGKSTLVEHVCDDERVRNHFSLILIYSGNDLQDGTAATFRENCMIKHQNTASDEERSHVVIELSASGDVDDGAWKTLLHSSERFMTHGSKDSEDIKFFLLGDRYQKGPGDAHGEVVCSRDNGGISSIGTWSARPRGRFEVLFWRSLIAPYCSYVSPCEFQRHNNACTI